MCRARLCNKTFAGCSNFREHVYTGKMSWISRAEKSISGPDIDFWGVNISKNRDIRWYQGHLNIRLKKLNPWYREYQPLIYEVVVSTRGLLSGSIGFYIRGWYNLYISPHIDQTISISAADRQVEHLISGQDIFVSNCISAVKYDSSHHYTGVWDCA